MSVSTSEARKTYNGDGVSVNFTTPYFLSNSDLKVYVDSTLKTITTDYSVSGAGTPSGGTVTMVAAPITGTGNVVIVREPDQLQSSQLPSNDPFPSKTVETALDKLTMLVQRLFDKTARTLSLSDSDSSSVSLTLPAASALKFFRWNASANAIENVDIASLGGVALPVPVSQGGTGAATAAAARASLAVLSSAENQLQSASRFTAGGTADAITGTLSPAIASYTAGLRVTATPGGANTVTGPTLNLNSLGTKTIKKRSSTGSKVALVAGDYNGSGPFDFEYDGTDFILLDPIPAAATTSTSVPVRQTVLSGPVDSNGFAAFGGSTGSTTVTASGTLKATAAAGGDSNYTGSIVNPSWTGLSTNGTMYLYLDIDQYGTCTAGSTTLEPTYQWGGTYSTTNLQNTFNIQEMTMKVGNGSTASQVYRVFVGEVTVAGGVTTAITWYALMGRYDSGYTATLPAAATYTSKNHNMGNPMVQGFFFAKCTTTDLGYAVGQVITPALNTADGVLTVAVDRLTVGAMSGNTGSGWDAPNRGTGAMAGLTAANWAYKFIVHRTW